MNIVGDDRDLRAEVEQLLFLEARLADESRYEEWLALMTEDVRYWVPSGRGRLRPRHPDLVRQRQPQPARDTRAPTPHRCALRADPAVTDAPRDLQHRDRVDRDDGTITAGSNFVLYELSAQATNELRIWAGRATHRIRRIDGGLRIAAKTVELVNASQPLPTLAFLL